jgi:hypothetical protein
MRRLHMEKKYYEKDKELWSYPAVMAEKDVDLLDSQGADPPTLYLNEEITPFLPTGIGEQHSKTISNLVHVALLRPKNESAELTQRPI